MNLLCNVEFFNRKTKKHYEIRVVRIEAEKIVCKVFDVEKQEFVFSPTPFDEITFEELVKNQNQKLLEMCDDEINRIN